MKKAKICFIFTLTVINLSFISFNTKRKYLLSDDILGVYVNKEHVDKMPSKDDAVFSKAVCDDDIDYYWDVDNWGLLISNLSKKVKCNLYFVTYSEETTFNFDYTGDEQTFTAPISRMYKLETWGAQGGSHSDEKHGGFGGYSNGVVYLNKDDTIFINIGGSGNINSSSVGVLTDGGYNGGGATYADATSFLTYGASGGGATHISLKSGLLSTLENFKNQILIVSGGGGGSNYDTGCNLSTGIGGSAGGYIGERGTSPVANNVLLTSIFASGGTQLAGGQGAIYTENVNNGVSGSFGIGGRSGPNSGGGGAGYYGGGGGTRANDDSSGGGGSGYIGNSLLKNKVMYCYNCEESSEEDTKTILTTCAEETPTSYCAKKGNGYARITLVSIDE